MFNIDTYNQISQKIKDFGKKTQIIAVSKNHPKSAIELAISHGVSIFGENRVQEVERKWPALREAGASVELHLIGALQTNKTRNLSRWRQEYPIRFPFFLHQFLLSILLHRNRAK